MLEMRSFEQTDWYGWAGATRFPSGHEPWICFDLKVDGEEAVLLVSGEEPGFLEVDLGEDPEVWHAKGANALNAIVVFFKVGYTTRAHMKSMGMERIN